MGIILWTSNHKTCLLKRTSKMTLKSLLTVFVFFFGIANAYQCVEVVEGSYRRTEEVGGEQTSTNITIPVPFRHCVPDLSDISSSCQCHGIHINNTGGSDCQSLDENGNSWCYVIGEKNVYILDSHVQKKCWTSIVQLNGHILF